MTEEDISPEFWLKKIKELIGSLKNRPKWL